MAPVRSLLFDFGNVIGFFDHHQGSARVAALLKAPPQSVHDFFYGTELEDRYDRGQISSDDLLSLLCERFNARGAPLDELRRAFGSVFWPNEAVIDVIRRVPPSIRLVLGSNTNELHYQTFAPIFADVFERFDAFVLSYTAGRRKPDPEFFKLCLEAAACPAGEVLFFDDRTENVAAATALGIRGVVYTPQTDLEAVLREHDVPVSRRGDDAR